MEERFRKLFKRLASREAVLGGTFQGVCLLARRLRALIVVARARLRDVDQYATPVKRAPFFIEVRASAIENPADDTVSRANAILERAWEACLSATLDLTPEPLAILGMNPSHEGVERDTLCCR